VDDDFGVGLGGKHVAGGAQFRAQFHVVEDFAVEDHANAAIFVGNGLATTTDVDDGQAGMTQCHVIVHVETGLVRAAMLQPRHHAAQQLGIGLRIVDRAEARQATHVPVPHEGVVKRTHPENDLAGVPAVRLSVFFRMGEVNPLVPGLHYSIGQRGMQGF